MSEELVHEIIYPVISITSGIIIYQLAFYFLKKWSQKHKQILPSLLTQYIYYPGLCLMFIFVSRLILLFIKAYIPERLYGILHHSLLITGICVLGFLLMRILTVIREVTLHHYAVHEAPDFSLRKANTRFVLLERIFKFIIIFITIGVVLMTFESVRRFGSTLLASAGVMGIVIAFAAQKSLGAMFAGIQIALSQPIRIGDTVVVEDQFGTIGEITLTYVVVNIWDGRRLIMPISYFLEETFENWTVTSPAIVGKVKIYADYTLPIEDVRQEFNKWIEESPLWDKRTKGLTMTGATDKTIEVRATMSARNSSEAYDLEVMIREKLITYIRTRHPYALPKTRIEGSSEILKKDE